MHTTTRLSLLLLSFVLIAVWVSVPALEQYSLQLVALALICFLGLRYKHNRENLTQIIPHQNSSELIPITIVCMLLVSATGNTHSWVYPFVYMYLFLVIFSLPKKAAALITLATVFLQAYLVPKFTTQEILLLLNIPIISGIMIFAKSQYEKAQVEEKMLLEEESELSLSQSEKATLEAYIEQFLLPKTEVLSRLEEPTTELEKTLHSQITLIVTESKKILDRSKK